jgi:hypothetical protein
MAQTGTPPRSGYEERFYVEAVWYAQEAAKAGKPPESAFDGMIARAQLFDAALADPTFRQEAVAVLQAKLPRLTPGLAQATLDHIFGERLKAQQDYARLAADPAFRAEVLQRAALPDGLKEKTPLVSVNPPCQLVLPEEPLTELTRYTGVRGLLGDTGVALLRMSEEALQQALVESFGGTDHLLHEPLKAAMSRTAIAVDQPLDDMADSFLVSRTKEAMDRAALLAPEGWVMQQLNSKQAATTIGGGAVQHQGAIQAAGAEIPRVPG